MANANFKEIIEKAEANAIKAANAQIDESLCGGAHLLIKANTKFGKYMIDNKKAKKYNFGTSINLEYLGQSADKYAAYAHAYADVLLTHDIKVKVETYLT